MVLRRPSMVRSVTLGSARLKAMKAPQLETTNPAIKLIEPDVERDAALGVEWLHGELGHSTLVLMGVADEDNKPTSLEAERARVQDFIEGKDQLNWMIQYEGTVVGSVWVDLVTKDELPAPAVHIMIGNPAMRGKGVGFSTVNSVLNYLKTLGHETIYSRHLTKNSGATTLLDSLGFHDLGEPHTDSDGLEWQNVVKTTSTPQ